MGGKDYWLSAFKFLQNLQEGKQYSNIILSSEINHNWVVFSKDDNLFIDHYGFRFFEDAKNRNWFFLSDESKLKLNGSSHYTIRFYLDSTDESIPDLLWELEKQYDEDKMMFYVDFDHCIIIAGTYNEQNITMERIITIDGRKHTTNNSFLHLISCENDFTKFFNLIKKSNYTNEYLEEFKTYINNKLNENVMFLVND